MEHEIDKEIDTQINEQLSNLIVNDIGPFTCQLFNHDSFKEEMIPLASGVLAELGGFYYILTASHVTEDWPNNNQLFVQIHGGYMSVVGITRGTEINKNHKIDVAYIKLDMANVIALKKGNKFLTLDRFKGHRKLVDSADYCVFGYPTINQKKVDGKLKTSGAACFVKPSKQKVLEHYGFDSMAHFVLDFQGKGIDIKTGENVKIKTEHYGLSGCGLWLTELNHDSSKFLSEAKLIGIMTEFRRRKYDCLIGCRLEIILLALRDFEGFKFRAK
ncbi:MAG TPA: hypothetical protein VKG26_09315 [Bacteroidia bacterium]|nr:hypothetical protein [Bacteroidia bacterium]